MTPARAALLIEERRRECVAVTTLKFFRWRLAGAGARCALQLTNVAPQFCPKALHYICRISLQSLRDPVGEHFKLTDVLESGRLCIRLRPGFIDQVLEGGGSVLVRGGGLPLLLNLDRV